MKRPEVRGQRSEISIPRIGHWDLVIGHSRGTIPRSFRIPHSALRARPAFTLLEIIFALALSAVLMAAALAAINMYRHVSTAGRREVEQAQLARAIFRMLEIDIRSAAFTPPPGQAVRYLAEAADEEETESATGATGTTGTTGGAGTAGGTDAEEPAEPEPTLDASAALADGDVGIYGDALSIVIHADRPTRSLEALQDLRFDPLLASMVGDRQSIAWFLSAASVPGLAGDSAAWFSQLSGDARSVQGLARVQGMQAALKQADLTGDTAAILSGTRLLAREVLDLRFRYFDGVAWQTEWNTAAAQRLPNAVEITLLFRDADEPEVVDPALAALRPRLHRHVVALPSAEPPVVVVETEEMIAP
ncbi:MAG: type II secretion system protein GspJ [Planctomycetales bacterium]